MPLGGLIPFLRYPLKNQLKSMVSESVFRGYLSEYSENSAFLTKNVHVYNLFIIKHIFIVHGIRQKKKKKFPESI